MPINVGEVEAVLAARDTMTPAMVKAAEKVAALRYELGELGTTSVTSFGKLNFALQEAEARFATMQTKAAMAGGGIKSMAAEVEVGAESLTQMDRLATRMIDRMVLLYALRGGFTFIKDLFDSSEALVSMSEKLDISIGKLQEIQYAADQTGVPFKTATSAIDTFDKKLSEMKATTGDALNEIGLSFEKLFAMSPDERINAVTAAISAMPNQLDRTRVEVALFGSDAIDPMIKQFGALSAEAHKANAVMSDETIKSLAMADVAYKQFFDTLKSYIAGAIVNAQQFVGIMAAPLFGGKFDLSALGSNIMHPFSGGGASGGDGSSGQSPTVGPGSEGPAMGDQYIEQLKRESLAVKDLSYAQKDQLAELKVLDMLTADNAAHLGVTTEQYKQYVAGIKEASAAQKAGEKAAEAYAQANERAIKQTIDLEAKDAESFAALQVAKDKAAMTAFNKLQAQEEAYYKHRFDTGQMSEESYNNMRIAIADQYNQRREALYLDERNQALANLNTKQAQEEAKMEELHNQGKISYEQYQADLLAIDNRYSNLREAVSMKYDADSKQRRLDLLAHEVSLTAKATAAIDAQAKSVHTLAGEWITVADAKKKAEGGNSETYDLSTSEGMAHFKQQNPMASVTAPPDYFKNHTLQQAIQSGFVNLYAGWNGAHAAEGGTVMVGERGPEVVNLPYGSRVNSHGTGGGGGGGVVVEAGAIVMNWPIMNDARAMDHIGKIAGDAILTRMRDRGYNVTRSISR